MADTPDLGGAPSRYETPSEVRWMAVRVVMAIAAFSVGYSVLSWSAQQIGMSGGIARLVIEIAIWSGSAFAFLRRPQAEADDFAGAIEQAHHRGAAMFAVIVGGIILLILFYAYFPE